jgi:hypothetical protein
MNIDPQELEHHYASLSDEALQEVRRDDLVEIAQGCLDRELARRGLNPKDADEEIDGAFTEEDPAVAVSNYTYPDEASEARDALEASGIPCYLAQRDEENSEEGRNYRGVSGALLLMVPSSFAGRALTVLQEEFGLEDGGPEPTDEDSVEAEDSVEDAQ